jgi:hypothetical protein
MGLFDFLKQAIGAADETLTPSMAEITIISSDSPTQTSESQSSTAQG